MNRFLCCLLDSNTLCYIKNKKHVKYYLEKTELDRCESVAVALVICYIYFPAVPIVLILTQKN
jgi:hypothetical protein